MTILIMTATKAGEKPVICEYPAHEWKWMAEEVYHLTAKGWTVIQSREVRK